MAYANKYKITYATKGGKTAYLYLQEDGYVGSLIEYQGMGLQLQYLPQSDDPYEPIYASQLNVSINVTDNLANMPDFTTNNDHKYFAKLYLDTDLQWVGWALSDSVSFMFSTGIKQLSFNCTDGIGMLQSINLPFPSSSDINQMKNMIYYFNLILNTLQLPSNPNLFTSCSYYASGMDDRSIHSYSEPFYQSYLPSRTFIKEDYTYIDCLTILKNIVKSFGCRIFMANGKWNIIQINQFANTTDYYTEYDYAGNVVSSGTYNSSSNIQGYTGNTSNVYFINNSQTKLIRKGYNKINLQSNYESAKNYITNGNLRPTSSVNVVYNWTPAYGGTGSAYPQIISNPNDVSDQYKLLRGSAVGAYSRIYNNGRPRANVNDIINMSWNFYGQSTDPIAASVYLTISNGTTSYYWSGDTWYVTGTGPSVYRIPLSELSNPLGTSQFTFSTKGLPISGEISFMIAVDNNSGNYCQVGNFNMTISPFVKSINVFAYTINNNQYIKEANLPYGLPSYLNVYPSELGIMCDSSGSQLQNWYQYGRSLYNYSFLAEMVMQSYLNLLNKNIINVDCEISSFNTNNGIINAFKLFTINDTDPAQINVSNNYYMIGNCTIDFPNDITKVTLLQIIDNYVSGTINYNIEYNSTN